MVLCHYQMAPCHDAAESLLHNGRNSTLYKYNWTESEYDPEIQKHSVSIKTKFKALIKKRPDLTLCALVSSTGRLKQQLWGLKWKANKRSSCLGWLYWDTERRKRNRSWGTHRVETTRRDEDEWPNRSSFYSTLLFKEILLARSSSASDTEAHFNLSHRLKQSWNVTC